MSVEENKAVIHRHVEEVFNQGDLDVVDEIVSPDYVYHGPLGEFTGTEGFKQIVMLARNAFPDINFVIDDMIGEGDKLAVRYSWTGTFLGKFGDLEPTGKKVNITAAYFYKFADGKEVEAIPYSDMLSFYQQIGATPPGG